ncbi:L,D-transpeptidase [Candidatus Nitronereus thalassa]|uniref:L,D-transpeptidase n=1 Tax=Candidatus Nitronereus thalassa TaxID=3020898 RepID=A0ABU3K5S7_9BACT|nr:L,D-transpeptidase [Candidatus Nitronereus thalassa]MDT7041733.1 L,D-transpeptidase [Candidatus Nitronereus thalassa]
MNSLWSSPNLGRSGVSLLSLLFFSFILLGSAESPSAEFNKAAVKTTSRGNGEGRSKKPSPSSLARLAPQGTFVMVDTAENRVYLKNGTKTLFAAVASTGSGSRLQDPRNPEKGWIFNTPRGIFSITGKIANPIWFKPDWAFIEEGLPIPTRQQDRAEAGVLGDYALGFGDGYFIHGTLYTRLLGTNVTHGCIRLGDKDLQYLYEHVSVGTTLIIY